MLTKRILGAMVVSFSFASCSKIKKMLGMSKETTEIKSEQENIEAVETEETIDSAPIMGSEIDQPEESNEPCCETPESEKAS